MPKKQKPFKPRAAQGPEYYIRRDIIRYMALRGWKSHIMHGNAFQSGIPDLYCIHPKYGTRWIDAKNSEQYTFTSAQKITWPEWEALGVGVWILVAGTEEEYAKLFKKPNFMDYWKPAWTAEREELIAAMEALYDEYDSQS
jgi:hypothetical protein